MAAAEHIIPAGGTPGVIDTGVTAFVDHMPGAWSAPIDRDRFLAGLSDLHVRSRERAGASFAMLDVATQLSVLASFDDDASALRAARNPPAHAYWFAMLTYLTV